MLDCHGAYSQVDFRRPHHGGDRIRAVVTSVDYYDTDRHQAEASIPAED